MIRQVMHDVLDPLWWKNFISMATDGHENMTGRHQVAAEKLESVFVQGFLSYLVFRSPIGPSRPAFNVYSIQNYIQGPSFMSLIGYPRRETDLRTEMESTSTAVSATIWPSMGMAITWILENSERVGKYLDEEEP